MSVAELLPPLQKLSHADKLRVMQFLLTEIAREDSVRLDPDIEYPIWSPIDAVSAGNILLETLAGESTKNG